MSFLFLEFLDMFSNCRLSLHMSKPGTFKEPVGSLVQSLRTFAVCAAERARELSPLGRCEEDPGIRHAILTIDLLASSCNDSFWHLLALVEIVLVADTHTYAIANLSCAPFVLA